MNAFKWDILVVGAGPAGSTAARAAAQQGAKVLLAERRSTIGVPVQCAEYIPAMLLGDINLGGQFVAQPIAGMKTFMQGERAIYTPAPGYIIHRDIFDQCLALAAEKEGVHVMTGTTVLKWLKSGTVILKSKNENEIKINPRIIIGADGPRSTVGKWVNAVNSQMLLGVQLTVKLAQPLNHTEIYFSPEIEAGYGWLFPKGTMANVGIGLKRNCRSTNRIRKILDIFFHHLKVEGKIIGPPVGCTAGWIPAEAVRRSVYRNVALVGDAAGHTHPITGAGILAAVTGGRMAGKWAGRAVIENDITLLEGYDREWQDLMGDTLLRGHRRRIQMEAQWATFNETVRHCWVAYREYYA